MTGQHRETGWLAFGEFIKKNPIPARIMVLKSILKRKRGQHKKKTTCITLVYTWVQGETIHTTIVPTLVVFREIRKISGDNIGVIISTKREKDSPVQVGTFTLAVAENGVCYQPPREMFCISP